MKIKLREERKKSSFPAVSVVLYVEGPTGSTKKRIGSGVWDYWAYGILQKSLSKRTVGRLNGGVLFAGNTSTGLVGIQTTRGQVFTGNASLVRDFTKKLKLGIEVFGGVTNDFNLSRANLKLKSAEIMPSVKTSHLLSECLAVVFPASPRGGVNVGFTYDFK